VDFKKLNATTKKRSFSITIHIWGTKHNGRCAAYSFLDGYFGYH
jgi:hypothetical protein